MGVEPASLVAHEKERYTRLVIARGRVVNRLNPGLEIVWLL